METTHVVQSYDSDQEQMTLLLSVTELNKKLSCYDINNMEFVFFHSSVKPSPQIRFLKRKTSPCK